MGRAEKIKLIIITAGISVASMLILYAIMRISGCNGNSPVRETVVIKDTIRFGGSEIIYKEIEPEIRKVKIKNPGKADEANERLAEIRSGYRKLELITYSTGDSLESEYKYYSPGREFYLISDSGKIRLIRKQIVFDGIWMELKANTLKETKFTLNSGFELYDKIRLNAGIGYNFEKKSGFLEAGIGIRVY